jgi:hypothetical protein
MQQASTIAEDERKRGEQRADATLLNDLQKQLWKKTHTLIVELGRIILPTLAKNVRKLCTGETVVKQRTIE